MCDEGETADRADAVRTESQKMESRAGETALDGSARSIIVLIVVGMLVGVLSGMFGIGGGTVIVPALVWLGLSQRNAAATSMLAIVPTAISGVVSYAAGGNVDWLAAALLFCGYEEKGCRRKFRQHPSCDEVNQPLTAPAITPLMMYFWQHR